MISLFSCNKDEQSSTVSNSPEEEEVSLDDPFIETLEAISTENNKFVTLSGRALANDQQVSSHGFEQGLDSLLSFDLKTINLGPLQTDGIYQFGIEDSLIVNGRYFFKAFISFNGKKKYGEVQSFLYNNGMAPMINSVSPELVHLGDTIAIRGEHFDDNTTQTKIKFSGNQSQIVSLTDSIIESIVPQHLSFPSPEIIVENSNGSGTLSNLNLYKPEINSVTPSNGIIGDTISIIGNHFDLQLSGNKVFIGNAQAEVIEASRTIIKAIVPKEVPSATEKIKVIAQVQEVIYEENFQLTAPSINSFSPAMATFGDQISIIGDNFALLASENKVYFDNVEAKVVNAKKDEIIVIVPDNLEKNTNSIRVAAQFQENVAPFKFNLTPPEISVVPTTSFANKELTIEGAYFHPDKNINIVTFEDTEAKIISGNRDSLTVTVPWGPYPRRKAKVKIQLLDLVVEHEIDLTILDKWIMISNTLPFHYYRSINNAAVAQGSAFVIAQDKNATSGEAYLWKLNSDNLSWEKSSLPFDPKWTGKLMTNGNFLYMYTANTTNDFWQYNPSTSSWSQKSSFIGNRRDGAAQFSINGDVFLGIGSDFEPYREVAYTDFYKYSPTSDSWTEVSSLPFDIWGGQIRTETANFSIDDIGYITGGARNTGDYDSWSYKASTDTWTQIADFPYAANYSVGFNLNGSGYVSGVGYNGLESWRYDAVADEWIQSDDTGKPRAGHFSFELNGRAYIGGSGWPVGSGADAAQFDLFEYVPE
ncbi:IPT/TIG domain-containing protein [Maribacter sp.]|uniref:IPT/TIG domain-containing protein n=1 Tax=Maribacter sp. TaxID=1897614 RepID=UPI003299BF8F